MSKKMICCIVTLILLSLCLPVLAETSGPVPELLPPVRTPVSGMDSGTAFEGYVNRVFGIGSAAGITPRNAPLAGFNKAIYDLLVPLIEGAAAGEISSSVFTINVSSAATDLGISLDDLMYSTEDLQISSFTDSSGQISSEATDAYYQKAGFNIGTIVHALMVNLPYDLYWFDKTYGYGPSFWTYTLGDEQKISVFNNGNLSLTMFVSKEFSSADAVGTTSFNTEITSSASSAAANAQNIVTDNAGLPDFEKLSAYKDVICSLVAYNDEAAIPNTFPYGNPWQLIWVFDNDLETNVVCEGYSKAFKYLCDNSSFRKNVSVSIVSGTMSGGTGAGAHMWNLVNMGEEKNYLVDVTNCDEGTVGYPDALFMTGYSDLYDDNNGTTGYIFTANNTNIIYVYDDDTKMLYAAEELTVADSDYVAPDNPQTIESGSCGTEINWTLDSDGVLTISGRGAMDDFWFDEAIPWYSYLSDIHQVIVSPGVTRIGANAFSNCIHLLSVSLPESLLTIGGSAFNHCEALPSVNIPESVTTIDWYAFCGCYALNSFFIPCNVTAIGAGAFSYNFQLSTITVALDNPAFIVEDGILYTKDKTELVCYPLTKTDPSFTVPGSVKAIRENAFGACETLTSIGLPQSLEMINQSAFDWCENLVEIIIPDSVISIGKNAFSNCLSLTSVTIPASVNNIGQDAFVNCNHLTDVYYGGPQNSWLSVEIQSGNDALMNAQLHCTQASGSCGQNVTWSLDQNGTLTIRGNGPMADYEKDTAVPWYGHRDEIVSAVIEPGVTSLGAQAFHFCTNLVSVSLPDGLTSIGEYVFNMCEKLNSIAIPDSVTEIGQFAFCGCYSLTSIHIPKNVTSIGYGALSYCHTLAELTVDSANTAFIVRDGVLFTADQTELVCYPPMKTGTSYSVPFTVTSVRDLAFTYCINLESVILPDTLTHIGNEIFSECASLNAVSLPSNLSVITYKMFASCDSLTELTLPSSLTSIDSCAFQFCNSLTNLTLPSSLTNIGVCAFQHCINLTGTLEIPSSVTSISAVAFQDCSSLTGLILPPSITSIGSWAFQNCSGIVSSLTLPEGLTVIEDGAFSGCSGLTGNLVIPSTVTTIGAWSFSGCSGFSGTLNIPSSLTKIADGAFQSCSGFTELILPSSITSIGAYSFHNCSGFASSLTLPEGLLTIGEGAFISCSGLTGNLIIPSTVTTLGQWVFSECTGFSGYLQLPNSIDNVQEATFYNCNGLKVIYYSGSSNEWSSFVHNPGPYNGHSVQFNAYVVSSNRFEINQDLLWVLDNRGFLTIFGNGEMDSFEETYYSGRDYPWGRENITGIDILEGVTSIGDYAFCSHTQLGFITFPSSVTEIGVDALAYCPALGDIYVADNNPNFSSIEGVLFNKAQTNLILYPSNRYSDTYTLPPSVTTIENNAFYECNQLTDITIPEGVTTIFSLAFAYSQNLPDITIPASVTQLSSDAFIGCSGLENIYVAAGNLHYSSINGVLFNAAGTSLVAYPCGRAGGYTVPDNVMEIQEYAFFRCDQLTDITLPESLSVIHDHAFQFSNGLKEITFPEGTVSIGSFSFQTCTNLSTITLPKSLSSIGRRAFYGCPLTDVYYAGLSLDAIAIDAGNEPLTAAAVHCHSIDFFLPDQLTTIESEAFAGIPAESFIYVPNTVTEIALDAFDAGTVIVTPAGSYAAGWAAENGFYCYEQ